MCKGLPNPALSDQSRDGCKHAPQSRAVLIPFAGFGENAAFLVGETPLPFVLDFDQNLIHAAIDVLFGRAVNAETLYAVALHEIGHLLGLVHSDEPSDLMYPVTTASDLTARDRRSARLLYALPPGSVKDP